MDSTLLKDFSDHSKEVNTYFLIFDNIDKYSSKSEIIKPKKDIDLAHGFKSFEEVGRGTNTEELLEIKDRVINYLQGIVENIEEYISKQEYLK